IDVGKVGDRPAERIGEVVPSDRPDLLLSDRRRSDGEQQPDEATEANGVEAADSMLHGVSSRVHPSGSSRSRIGAFAARKHNTPGTCSRSTGRDQGPRTSVSEREEGGGLVTARSPSLQEALDARVAGANRNQPVAEPLARPPRS